MSGRNQQAAASIGMPNVGLGVYKFEANENGREAIITAINAGYRLIDTAQFYDNEEEVGQAVEDSKIPREEFFIVTKLRPENFAYQTAIDTIQASLKKLKTPYVDLLLLHAPGDPVLRVEAWRALEHLHSTGILKNIGVSNFGIPHLEKLALTSTISPAVNQIELHPWMQRPELVEYCVEHNIIVQAWSPLARGNKLTDPIITQIAEQIHATNAQVLIAWGLQKGFVVLPKSVNAERQAQNLAAGRDFTLSTEHMAILDGLEEYYVSSSVGFDPIKTAAV
jgi:diketogulonate reductase-like aldo/keto reductase